MTGPYEKMEHLLRETLESQPKRVDLETVRGFEIALIDMKDDTVEITVRANDDSGYYLKIRYNSASAKSSDQIFVDQNGEEVSTDIISQETLDLLQREINVILSEDINALINKLKQA